MSLGGKAFGFIMVDEFYKFTLAWLLANKFDAFEEFRKFAKYIQREKGHLINIIKLDNGGEFGNKSFEFFLISLVLDITF